MPYKDPAKQTAYQREWDLTHRPEKGIRAREAQDWADFQIQTLMKIGVKHSRKEWRSLKGELVGQFLKDKYGLGVDRPPNPS